MGLMDKLKAAKNAVTGGAASVSLEIGEAKRGEVVNMKITAVAKANLSAKKVYILVRAVEEAAVEDYDTRRGRETVRCEYVSHELSESKKELSSSSSRAYRCPEENKIVTVD